MKTLYITILMAALPLGGHAQFTDFKARTFTNGEGDSLRYRILTPAGYNSAKAYPLVLFLHGAGERGSDNFSQLKWGVYHFSEPIMREKYPAFVVAPQVPEGEVWSTLSINDSTYTIPMRQAPTRTMRLTVELIEKLQHNYSVDPERLYVTGLSMGGFGTFDLIERFPNRFAAAVPVAGGGDVARAFLLKEMPLWVFHGARDQVVPPQYSRTIVQALQLAGGSPGFTEYPDAGHVGAWIQAYNNPRLYEWMFSKRFR